MKTVQIGVLVQDTGEKTRTLQHWSDLGILRPEKDTDKQGRGNFRIYRAEPLHGERTWALLASAFFKLRLPLGDIRELIYAHRLLHDPEELLNTSHPDFEGVRAWREEAKNNPSFADPFKYAIAGEPNVFTVITEPLHITYLRQNGGGPRHPALVNNEMILNVMAESKSAVMLNLSKIFEPLRAERALADQEVGTNRNISGGAGGGLSDVTPE